MNEAEKIFFDVMLVMDASGSMPVNDPVADRKHIAQSYINTFIPCKEAGSAACDRAGLIAFNDFAFLLQTLTEDLDLTEQRSMPSGLPEERISGWGFI